MVNFTACGYLHKVIFFFFNQQGKQIPTEWLTKRKKWLYFVLQSLQVNKHWLAQAVPHWLKWLGSSIGFELRLWRDEFCTSGSLDGSPLPAEKKFKLFSKAFKIPTSIKNSGFIFTHSCGCSTYHTPLLQTRGWQTFSVKVEMVNILVFVGQPLFAATTLLL